MVVALPLALGAPLGAAAGPAREAASLLHGARAAFALGASAAGSLDLGGAERAFTEAGRLAAGAGAALRSPLVATAGWVPVAGDNLRAAAALAEGTRLAAGAAREAVGAAREFPDGPAGPRAGIVRGRIDPAPWPRAEERLRRAAAGARRALERVRGAGGLLLPPVARARSEFLREGERLVAALERGAAAAGLMPAVFGADGPRTWFLVIQNPVELRATGGFLGAFGILQAEGGRLRLERFEPNTGLPPVGEPAAAPPEFAARYERFAARSMWQNVNMTPDFPTAAGVMAAMWRGATGQEVDGVIAVDAAGLAHLLEVVGPVSVPEAGEVTADTFLPLALNEAYLRFPEKPDRARALIEAGRRMWERLLATELTDVRQLAGPLGRAVAGRHIQVWSPAEEGRLRRLGIDGRIGPPPEGDYLLVVAQNAAANKVDYYARRRIHYRVDVGDDGVTRSRLTVSLANGTPAGLPSSVAGPYLPADPPGLNRSYVSVYLAPGTGVTAARLDGERAGVESHRERGLAVASRFLEVMPQRTSALDLFLRGRVARPGEYRLRVRRQPSLHPDAVRIEVALPHGSRILSTEGGLRAEGRRLVWKGDLTTDREIAVRYTTSLGGRLRALLPGGG